MKYFTIAELCHSNTANEQLIDNKCTKEHVINLTALVDNILDPLREAYGKPIVINSGYRCEKLNKKVGGAKTAGGNLAASNIRNLECPSYEVYLIDYGCGKFNKKVHIME